VPVRRLGSYVDAGAAPGTRQVEAEAANECLRHGAGFSTGTYSFSQHGTIALNLANSPGQTTPFEPRGSGTITLNIG
jgi:hypothetical protein